MLKLAHSTTGMYPLLLQGVDWLGVDTTTRTVEAVPSANGIKIFDRGNFIKKPLKC